MTLLLSFALSLVAPLQEMVAIPIDTRDYATVDGSTEVISGTCDGRPVSATITKAFRGREGRLTLRAGRISRPVPPGFLGGRLVRGSYYAAGIGCDGRRIVFRARVARMAEDGRVNIEVQSVTMDMRTGRLSVSEARTMDRDETRLELR